MELLTTLTLFGSLAWFIVSLVALFIVFIACDIEESGTSATVSFFVFIGLHYFWGNLPLVDIFFWKNVLMYLFLGFIFSFVRTYFKGKELRKKYYKDTHKPTEDGLKVYKSNYDLKSSVFRWLFLFPISLITWVCGTLFVDAWHLFYDKVGGIYSKVLNA